ncbi:MAG: prepilin-type N-terminal cleavage/methylation domain-containing protein [Planctomycetota bacterium]|jgi:prepilin-type N-terminal cleavage/methylation domain-containing protein/prepilin-type processing-associated H-X9-DG protein
MRKLKGFTLIELLVVIAIIALLLAILMPSLSRVRAQAKAVACMSNIKQWSLCWHMYLDESDGKFPSGAGASGDWPAMLRPYYKDRGALTLCPSAVKPYNEGGRVPFGAWRWQPDGGGWGNFEDKQGLDYGSYGMDEWLGDRTHENCWRHREQKKASTIPLFFDCVFLDVYANHTQGPPELDGLVQLPNEMHLVCINRHNGYINTVFLDLNVRKVGLKELWTLDWHRNFDTEGVWTIAGGVQAEDWPVWMRKLKDY